MFFDKRYASTALPNPDFVAIAKAYKIEARKIELREDLKDALQKMIETKGPYLLEITVENEANVFPMIEPGSAVSEIRLTY